MKAKALEIRWHDTQPIFSADFHAIPPEQHRRVAHPYARTAAIGGAGTAAEKIEPPQEKLWRLATAGGDKLVRLWLVRPRPESTPAPLVLLPMSAKPPPLPVSDGSPTVEYLATLKQHTGVVNVVRFAPIGETLASAGDDGNILFWVPGESSSSFGDSIEDKAYEKESWRVMSMLRTKSGQEIYDLAWSSDGKNILAGSVDHTANIYDAVAGQLLFTIAEHTNYVQGVAWDPLNRFIATQSSDRSMHIYTLSHTATGLQAHAVGKNSRMEVQSSTVAKRQSSTPSAVENLVAEEKLNADRPSLVQKEQEDEKEKEKQKEKNHEREGTLSRPPPPQRSVSRASDSDRSESSVVTNSTATTNATAPVRPFFAEASTSASTPLSTVCGDEPRHAMNPPSHPRPTSRRSSTSSSLVSRSPGLLPQQSGSQYRHLRSPSPAPLPAVRLPLSPTLSPAGAPSAGPTKAKGETIKLYGDANSTPFFRRLCWSTDGSLLLTPAGLFEDPYAGVAKNGGIATTTKDVEEGTNSKYPPHRKNVNPSSASTPLTHKDKVDPKPTVYIYARSNVSRPPIAHLPGHKTTSIAIRFCPVLWELRKLRSNHESDIDVDAGGDDCLSVDLAGAGSDVRLPGADDVVHTSGSGAGGDRVKDEEKPKSLFDLPYRMVYAVATLDAVYLYDTQQASPICMFGNLHYAPFTDLSWSADGQTLVVSSQDGYCSIVAFEPHELGSPYHLPHSIVSPALLPPPAPLPSERNDELESASSTGPSDFIPPPADTASVSTESSTFQENSVAAVPQLDLPPPVTNNESVRDSGFSSHDLEEEEGDLKRKEDRSGTNVRASSFDAVVLPAKKKKKVELKYLGPLGSSNSSTSS